jgi:hypothetical protein
LCAAEPNRIERAAGRCRSGKFKPPVNVGKTMEKTMIEDRMTKEEFLAGRKAAGLRIDPNSADVEVTFWWAQVLDPYGVQESLPPECRCVGREHFARSPDSGGWVNFSDLPDKTQDELWRRTNSGELVDSLEEQFFEILK